MYRVKVEKKILLYYKWVIQISLPKEEVIGMIRDVTISKEINSVFIKIRDYMFYKGKFSKSDFVLKPLPIWIPPFSHQNVFTPVIMGRILREEKGYCMVEIKSISRDGILFLFFVDIVFLAMFFINHDIVKAITFLLVGNMSTLLYCNFVAKKTFELLDKLFRDNVS